MTSVHELRRSKDNLQFSRTLLTVAALLQVPTLAGIALTQSQVIFHYSLGWTLPSKVFWMLDFGTALLAIIGFTMVCRQLSLWEGNLESTEFVQRTRVLGTAKIAAGVQLFFYLSFLMPLINLVPVLWARSQAKKGILDLEDRLKASRPRR